MAILNKDRTRILTSIHLKLIWKALLQKIFLSLLLLSNLAIGGVADLSIELEFNENDGIVFDQFGAFTVRITNFGPDIAAVDASFSYPISLFTGVIRDNGSFTPEIQFGPAPQNNNQECFFALIIGEPPPGGSVSYAYEIFINPLQVGQTIECFGLYSTHFDSGSKNIEWAIHNTFDEDPDPTNDAQTVIFGISPRSVPVNNLPAMISLVCILLLMGLFIHRKRKV